MPTSPSSEGVKPTTSVADVEELFRDDAPDDKADKGDKGDKSKDKGDKGDKKDDDDNIDLNLDDEGDDEDKIDLDDKKGKKKATKDKEDDDDDDDDDELDDKDDDDDDDDDDEADLEIEGPPRKKEVTAKYPNFFKEFKWFEKMMYRDRQYTELFGSFDDAKDAHAASLNLRALDEDLSKGDLNKILSTVKEHNSKAFDKLVDNYLPALFKVDKDAYFEITTNVAKQIIKEVYSAGQGEDNDELKKLALELNKFLFKSSTWTPPTARVGDKDKSGDEDDKVNKERQEFMQERYEVTLNDLQERVDNVLRSAINEHIDPKGEMSDYVKKNAVRDALSSLHKLANKDVAFKKTLDRLWQSSFGEKFSKGSVDRIKSTYLGRAKKLLPGIIRKARAEALKGLTPSSHRNDDDDEDTNSRSNGRERKEPINPGRPRQSSGKKSLTIEKGESVYDFLSRD